METTLHQQLKALYAGGAARTELAMDRYRIDAVTPHYLVEIQQASLAALRNKVRTLVQRHQVLVVKPLAARTRLIQRSSRGGPLVCARFSPRRETFFHLFDELVHFVGPFPHPRLTLEAVLIEQEEVRFAACRRRRFGKDYRVEDRRLSSVEASLRLRTAADLTALLPQTLAEPFTTADIAAAAGVPRWLAQKAAYCLRKVGGIVAVGKRGNAWLYRLAADDELAAAA